MFGNSIRCRIKAFIRYKVGCSVAHRDFHSNASCLQRFAQHNFSKSCWRWHKKRCESRLSHKRQTTIEGDENRAIWIRLYPRWIQNSSGVSTQRPQVIAEFHVRSLWRRTQNDRVINLRAWRHDKINQVVIDDDRGEHDTPSSLALPWRIRKKTCIDQDFAFDLPNALRRDIIREVTDHDELVSGKSTSTIGVVMARES